MTEPSKSSPLSPVRRGRAGRQAPEQVDEADLARGQAAAVLGALGRLQLRVDVLAREQAEALRAIRELLEGLDQRVAELTADNDEHVGPAAAGEPASVEPPSYDAVQEPSGDEVPGH